MYVRLFLIICLWAPGVVAEVIGFSKLNILQYDSAFDSKDNYESFQINRVTLNQEVQPNLIFEASYELVQIYSDLRSPGMNRSYSDNNLSYRYDNFNPTLAKNSAGYYLNSNLDRLLVTYETEVTLVSFGRQQLAFGSGRGVNPTDVFTPFSFSAIDTEIRSGVDAFRIRHQLGSMQEIDFAIISGENFKKEGSAAYFLVRWPLGSFEVQPMLAQFREAKLGGLEVTTDLAGASVWWEYAHVKPLEETSYDRYVLGAQRQLTETLSLFGEYHFNGAGTKNTKEFVNQIKDFAFTKGGVFLLGKNYLDLGGSYMLSSLHNINLMFKGNLDDNSTFVSMVWEWSVTQNTYFNLGALLGMGKRPISSTQLQSEFGAFPSSLYTRLRYYF